MESLLRNQQQTSWSQKFPYILETDDLLSLHAIHVYRVSDDDINNGLGRRERILLSMQTVELRLFNRM